VTNAANDGAAGYARLLGTTEEQIEWAKTSELRVKFYVSRFASSAFKSSGLV
jgi:hypothetical protein